MEVTCPVGLDPSLWDLAVSRREISLTYPSHRETPDASPIREYIGLRGEEAFAVLIGRRWFPNMSGRGDNGIDFRVHIEGRLYSLDVKTTMRRPPVLRVCTSARRLASLYVLAFWTEGVRRPKDVAFLGWATRPEVLAAPDCNDWPGHPCKALQAGKLRKMIHLLDMIE